MNINNKLLKVFVSVALIFSITYIFLILQNRVPFTHTTAQSLQLQYVYFNELVQNHSLPIWFPFTISGTVGNFHFIQYTTLLSPIFYFLGLFFKGINYLYLFYFGLWFEELFFLLGVILLSSLYYKKTKTIFFVSLTLLGTSIWYPEIWWNFRQYYFIPIMLYCIHRSFTTGLFRYFIFSVLFFGLTEYTNIIYFFIFISFVVLVYVLFIALTHFNEIKMFLRRNVKLKNIAILLVLLTIMLLSFYYIKYGDSEIVLLKAFRDSSRRVTLSTFLTFGGSIGFDKYKEFFRRYGNSIDINLYAGFFLAPFVLLSLLYGRKKLSFVVGGVALILFLFSSKTLLTTLFYYIWPFAKYFRHTGLTATVFKLFIVFYAGFGFEEFLKRMRTDKKVIFLILISLIAVGSLFIINPYAITTKHFWFASDMERTIFSVTPYAILGLGASIFLLLLMSKTKPTKKYLVNLLLLLLVFDFVVYKHSLITARMPRGVSNKVINLFKPYKYDFPRKRLHNLCSYIKDSERMAPFDYQNYKNENGAYIGYLPKYYRGAGAVYNTIESFFFIDSAVSYHDRSFILKPYKDYFDIKRDFPNNNGAYKKYSGVNYPKLGVFSRLNLVEDRWAIGEIFNLESFTGDMLFTTNKDVRDKKEYIPSNLIRPKNVTDFKNQNERIASDIVVEKFSFNMLKLKVSTGGSPNKYCFLYYSDIYHPHWNAYVNGRKTPVIRSNIGYKSIMIPYGTSEVAFKFGNTFYQISIFCTILLSLAILYTIFYLLQNDLIKREIP